MEITRLQKLDFLRTATLKVAQMLFPDNSCTVDITFYNGTRLFDEAIAYKMQHKQGTTTEWYETNDDEGQIVIFKGQ